MVKCWGCSRSMLSNGGTGKQLGLLKINVLIVTMVNFQSAQGRCCHIVIMVNCWVCSRLMLSYGGNSKLLGLLKVNAVL